MSTAAARGQSAIPRFFFTVQVAARSGITLHFMAFAEELDQSTGFRAGTSCDEVDGSGRGLTSSSEYEGDGCASGGASISSAVFSGTKAAVSSLSSSPVDSIVYAGGA